MRATTVQQQDSDSGVGAAEASGARVRVRMVEVKVEVEVRARRGRETGDVGRDGQQSAVKLWPRTKGAGRQEMGQREAGASATRQRLSPSCARDQAIPLVQLCDVLFLIESHAVRRGT
jgi:hypothetical protein